MIIFLLNHQRFCQRTFGCKNWITRGEDSSLVFQQKVTRRFFNQKSFISVYSFNFYHQTFHIFFRAKWRREEKLRTQRLSTPNNNNNNTLNVNNNEISCANDTNSSTETNPKANITNGSSSMNNMLHNPHIGSSMADSHNSGIIGDMHNPLLNGNHHLSTPSSLITPASSAPSLSPPRFNFNHGFCSTMSPMYTPQMSISDSYRFVTNID